MIINNLLLKLRNADADSIKKTQEILLSMRGKIDVLIDIQAEINIRPGKSNYDIILITKFASLEDGSMSIYWTQKVELFTQFF